MRKSGNLCVVKFITTAFLAAFAATATPATADEPLRWKFTPGEKLRYTTTQDMTMSADGGPIGGMESKVHQTMEMTWEVQQVAPEGDAVIQQRFDRVRMRLSMEQHDAEGKVQPIGGFEYDTDSDEAPVGMAAMLAPLYKALTEHEFVVTMSNRGEVKAVEIPDEVVTAMKNIPGIAAMGDFATAEGFKKMIAQGTMVLPEQPPQPGEEWSTSIEIPSPVGAQKVETTYRYEGTREIDGTEFAVVHPEMSIEFVAGLPQPDQPPMDMKIREQSSSGESLFNVAEGRLHTSTMEQTITIEIAAEGQTMEQQIETKVEVTVTPLE